MVSLSNFCSHCIARAYRLTRFKWETRTWLEFSGVEEVHASKVGHLWIADHFDCVLELVTN